MKLWNRNQVDIDRFIEKFTIGNDRILDLELAKFDVMGSRAHARMLSHIELITEDDLNAIEKGLNLVEGLIANGEFEIEEGIEDVHSQIEKFLVENIGEAGKKIHTGRSRNDQVLVDLRLYFRERLSEFESKIGQLVRLLIKRSEECRSFLMPGYTHMQMGMVSSFGLWLGSYAEAMIDDYALIRNVKNIINQNPLGSAAGYGSSFPIDRSMTTRLLEFDDMCYNSMYAQFGRGKTELLVAQAISALAYTLSRFAMDVCLFNSQNYSLVFLPDEVVTGSSIMPHKKNPDVFELIRGRCNHLMALPGRVLMVCQNLPSGYHRDFQELKELLFPAILQLDQILEMLIYVVPKIEVNKNALDGEKYDALFSVEEINKLALKGMSFRDAYHEIKLRIQNGEYKPDRKLKHVHEGSIGNLSNQKILEKLEKIESL